MGAWLPSLTPTPDDDRQRGRTCPPEPEESAPQPPSPGGHPGALTFSPLALLMARRGRSTRSTLRIFTTEMELDLGGQPRAGLQPLLLPSLPWGLLVPPTPALHRGLGVGCAREAASC